jgi:hypothetical protein
MAAVEDTDELKRPLVVAYNVICILFCRSVWKSSSTQHLPDIDPVLRPSALGVRTSRWDAKEPTAIRRRESACIQHPPDLR